MENYSPCYLSSWGPGDEPLPEFGPRMPILARSKNLLFTDCAKSKSQSDLMAMMLSTVAESSIPLNPVLIVMTQSGSFVPESSVKHIWSRLTFESFPGSIAGFPKLGESVPISEYAELILTDRYASHDFMICCFSMETDWRMIMAKGLEFKKWQEMTWMERLFAPLAKHAEELDVIAVCDAAVSFLYVSVDLGYTVLGRSKLSGSWPLPLRSLIDQDDLSQKG